MPFKDEFFEVYETLKIKFADEFEFSNAGDEANQQNILKDIIQPIYDTDIIIADLTGLNANVMYELGLAHAFNKKTIIITQNELSELPFDLKQYRVKDYNTHFKKFDELIEYLRVNLKGATDNSILFGNPVNDFLKISQLEKVEIISERELITLQEDTDKGFLDFLADIESNTEKMKNHLVEMTTEMDEMGNKIEIGSREIDRIKGNGGNGNAVFVRKETQKVAKAIDTFRIKLKPHNNAISELWDYIENDTLGLLDNKFSTSETNRQSLINFLKTLNGTRNAIKINDQKIATLMESMQSVIGIERSLSQALRFLLDDLKTYRSIMERMQFSIIKILEKSKNVVGLIDFDE